MNIASMFLRILAIVGAIAAGVMFWMIGDTKERLEADLTSTENQLNSTRNDLNTLRGEHETLQEEAAQLTTALEESQARANTLENQLAQTRRELAEATRAADAREREAETLRQERARIQQELIAEKERAQQLANTLESEDAAKLRAHIARLEEQLIRTNEQLQNIDTASSQQADGQGRAVLRGEVTEVSDQSAYIVIDLGSVHGARENATVMLRRGPTYVGRARISDVRDNVSIAELLPGTNNVRTGDQAVTLN